LGWIANYELRKLLEILDFCRRRCWNDFKGEALAAIAKRFKAIDKDQAFELLLEARQSTADLFFAHKRLVKSVVDEAMEIDPDRGLQLLFSSFREHHQRYPQSIVHELDEVVRFHAHFPRTDFKALYDVWSGYNRALAAGLALKPVNTTYLHSALPASFLDAALLYLIRMLDYPDVNLRFLAPNACFTLLERGVTTPQALLKQWDGMNATQKEMLVSVLSSFSLKHPESRSAWISPLLDLAKTEVHLNLRRSVAHLALGGIATGLPPGALQAAKDLQDPRSNVPPNGGLA
jgi:hypothetical protein